MLHGEAAAAELRAKSKRREHNACLPKRRHSGVNMILTGSDKPKRGEIRKASIHDLPAIDRVFRPILLAGETHLWGADITPEVMRSIWFASGCETFVLEEHGAIVATYCIKPNQPCRGAHVANGNYAVAGEARRRGLGNQWRWIRCSARRRWDTPAFNLTPS